MKPHHYQFQSWVQNNILIVGARQLESDCLMNICFTVCYERFLTLHGLSKGTISSSQWAEVIFVSTLVIVGYDIFLPILVTLSKMFSVLKIIWINIQICYWFFRLKEPFFWFNFLLQFPFVSNASCLITKWRQDTLLSWKQYYLKYNFFLSSFFFKEFFFKIFILLFIWER